MFGISLPNPLDGIDIPGTGRDSVERDPPGASFDPAVQAALDYCCKNAEYGNIFGLLSTADEVDKQKEQAAQKKFADPLIAASLVLQSIPTLDQCIFSEAAVKKLYAGHYYLYGPSRLKAAHSTINRMDASTVENARLFFKTLSLVYEKQEFNCTPPDSLFTNAGNAVLVSTKQATEWDLPKQDASGIMAFLVNNFECIFNMEECDLKAIFGEQLVLDKEDAHSDIGTRYAPEKLAQDTQKELAQLAVEIEGEVMQTTDFHVQARFTFLQLVEAEEMLTVKGKVSSSEIHRTKRALREANARAATLERRHNDMKQECERLKAENEEVNKNTLGWYAQVQEVQPKLSELEQTTGTEITALTNKVEYLQLQLSTEKTKKMGLQERVDTLSAGLKKTKQEMVMDDAVMELQAAIQEAEGLYSQVEQLERQINVQDEKLNEQTDVLGQLASEKEELSVEVKWAEDQATLITKKFDLATEGYQDAKIETRHLCHEIALLQRKNHDLEFQLVTMAAEQAIVEPRLNEDERAGLLLLKDTALCTTTAESLEEKREGSALLSELVVLAATHKAKVDKDWQQSKEIINQNENKIAKYKAENKELNDELQKMTIEFGLAKLGRNQFLQLSRELRSKMDQMAEDHEGVVEHYLKEMKFFSEQYSSVTKTNEEFQASVDIMNLKTKALDLELNGSDFWAGLNNDMGEFSQLLKAGK